MAQARPITIIEPLEFRSTTRKLMGDEERALPVDYLACNPTASDIVAGTGGVRKLR